MAVSKKAASSKAAPKAASDNCAKCDAKIEALEKKILDLESKLTGVLASVEALAQVKSDLDDAKEKLGSEVKELKENAKSWITKQKESADSNGDGVITYDEVWEYCSRRIRGESHRRAKRGAESLQK
tara:strand:+ start:1696 stop:2076 length:381 start_codon:yes stop_codon:yes gene_type:complete